LFVFIFIGHWSLGLGHSNSALAAEPAGEQRALLKTFRDEFVAITPGQGKFPERFTMGGEVGPAEQRPPREVTFDYAFHVAKYEVPQNLWEAVMRANPSRWKGPRNSVEMISFDEANAFCAEATKLLRAAKLIRENEMVRLPTEAEWEYAARAGTATTWSFGDDATKIDDYAWHTGNAAGNDPPVGAKKPNPWGLYDTYGYLSEWTADPWHANYQGAPHTAHVWPNGEAKRVAVRGGSWKDTPEHCTSRFRQPLDKLSRDDAVGFRCVLAATK
jgi:formylglycine-generating enzyme required for sulfatase activity